MQARQRGAWVPDHEVVDPQALRGARVLEAVASLNSTHHSKRVPQIEAVITVRNRSREIAKLCVQEVVESCVDCESNANCEFLKALKNFQRHRFTKDKPEITAEIPSSTEEACGGRRNVDKLLGAAVEIYLGDTNHSPTTRAERMSVLYNGVNYLKSRLGIADDSSNAA